MNNVNHFEDLFESISNYGKIVILTFFIDCDVDIIQESGFLKKIQYTSLQRD